jgi:hypothetical protein
MAKKPRRFSAKTQATLTARMAKAGQRGGAFQPVPEGKVYSRPPGTKPAKLQPTGPLDPRHNPLPTSGLNIFPAVRVATRRLQSHVGPSPQASKVTRRRRI